MRGKELIKKRDHAIIKKFYEEYDIKRRRMDDVLIDLSENMFYLDKNYIYARIFYNKENYDYYLSLTDKNKSSK